MSDVAAKELLYWMQTHQDEMLDFIQQLVMIESPSNVPETQKPVLDLLSAAFSDFNYQVKRIPGRNSGGHLFARPRKREKNKPLQLLLGHCDTVWPIGTIKEMPLKIDNEIMQGPGVFDMKTGLTQILFVLRALHELDLQACVIPIVFINSDEEIGSPESSTYIHKLARLVNRSLVLEPSLGPAGRLKTARKGVGSFTVTAKGKAAHAGLNPEAGASAILEISHVIQKLFELNDVTKGISVNVGTIDGGLRANVIAPISSAEIDVRALTREDAEAIEQAIHNIQPVTPGVSLEIKGGFRRQPLEKTSANRAFWHVAVNLAQEINLDLQEGTAGGGSDGNTASLYHATLDGLGAVGDGAHARHEHIDMTKLAERSALLGLLLLAPALEPGKKG
jgi:glutamate carboxypeptidase